MRPPTEKQLDTLRFIATYSRLKERPPTVRDTATYFKITTKGANDRLSTLARKGLIDREPHIYRGINITAAGRELILLPAEAYAVIGGRRWLYRRVAVSV